MNSGRLPGSLNLTKCRGPAKTNLPCTGYLSAQCLTQEEACKDHQSQKEVHLQARGMGVVPLKAL